MPGTVQELASMFRKAIDSEGNVSLSDTSILSFRLLDGCKHEYNNTTL